jgi:hypothetical protein
MKGIKKFGILLSVSLIVQLGGLYSLEKFYFEDKNEGKSNIADSVIFKQKETNLIDVPSDATQVSLSFDGSYLAYYEGTELKVVNTSTLEVKKVQFEEKTKVSFYKWVPNKNTIIMGGKQKDTFNESIKFIYLDIKDKNSGKEQYKDLGTVVLPDKVSEVEDIEFSSSNETIYIKINHAGNRNSIYTLNGKEFIEEVHTNSFFVGQIQAMKKEDKMLYEDSTFHKIYVNGEAKPIEVKGVSNPRLISIDSEDNIYIAQTEGNKVKKIYYGKRSQSSDTWRSIDIKDEVNVKDVIVMPQGKIYINDDLKGSITEVVTGKEFFYKGNFIQLYSDGIATVSEWKLLKIKIY